ncbi:MAG: hypothetical protein ABIH46_05785 [Chloroflexota bacterium]
MRRYRRSRVWDTIDVLAPGVDVERLFKTIESNLASQRTGSWRGLFVPSYDDLLDPVGGDDTAMPRTELEYYLRQVRAADVTVTPLVLPSGVPIVGRLLDLLKRQLHNLILFYVNILAGKQSHHNAQVFRAITILSKEVLRLRTEADKTRQGTERKARSQR